jgi:uncharacterized protein (TIGR02444 family)
MTKHASRFWPFSLSVYEAAGVQQECLDLQDRCGIDVDLLLFCAYIGAVHSAVLPTADVTAASAVAGKWNDGVVRKLREARHALKPFSIGSSLIMTPADALRTQVKAAELEAERIEQAMLEEWSDPRIGTWPRAEAAEAVATNIRTLLAVCGASQQADLPGRLIAAAVAAAAH